MIAKDLEDWAYILEENYYQFRRDSKNVWKHPFPL